MVERCRDCGFDLAGGLVEVVPTAHYFMGGVICEPDTSTGWPGLFVAGEDASGMHGANRLGGNGVANSTVFGGIAGDTMPNWIARNPAHRAPDQHVLDAEVTRALHPFARKPGDLNRLRERLMDAMWDEVGVIRDAAGLDRGIAALADIEAELLATGVPAGDRRFDLTWHDWLNLRSLVEVSRGDRPRGEGAGELARRPFPRRLPGAGRSRRPRVSRWRSQGRRARNQRRAGALYPCGRPGETRSASPAREAKESTRP